MIWHVIFAKMYRKRQLRQALRDLGKPVPRRCSFDTMQDMLVSHRTKFVFAMYQKLDPQGKISYVNGCEKEAMDLVVRGFYYTMDSIEHCASRFTVHGIRVYQVGPWMGILVDAAEAARIHQRNRASYEEYTQPEPNAVVDHQFQTRPHLQQYFDCIRNSGLLFIDWCVK